MPQSATAKLNIEPLSKNDYELLANFRYQLRVFLRFSEEITQAQGITPLQYQLLLQVKGFPGREWATIAELAERLQSLHHGMVSLVSRCEKAGFLQRKPGRDDKRCVEVHLKAKGEKLLHQIALLHKNQLADLQHVLDALVIA